MCSIYYIMAGGLVLDIMTSMKGPEGQSFDECLAKARIITPGGVKIPFLHINDLLANKKAVNRSKDQLDVIELEKIKKLKQGNPGLWNLDSAIQGFSPPPPYLCAKFQERYGLNSCQMLIGSGFQLVLYHHFCSAS